MFKFLDNLPFSDTVLVMVSHITWLIINSQQQNNKAWGKDSLLQELFSVWSYAVYLYIYIYIWLPLIYSMGMILAGWAKAHGSFH